ncbi:hypothetical protein MLD52_12370 [Puniceicoccaceae bacterium K14]|nr:hypothetical protein [Puniceicoccaceae bacterium K14]
MGRTTKQVIIWLLNAWVGIAFVYAGTLKLMDLEGFVSSILTYGVFDFGQSVIIASWVAPLEVIAGLGVLLKRTRSGGSFILTALLVVFLVMIFQAYMRGLEIDCGCFGGDGSEESDYLGLIVRDKFMLFSLVGAYFLEKRWQK